MASESDPLALSSILQRLQSQPELSQQITFPVLLRFLRLAHRAWGEIHANHVESGSIAEKLPSHVLNFLATVMSVPNELVSSCWATFRDLVPSLNKDDLGDDDMFRLHGSSHKIGAEDIRAPVKECQICPSHVLTDSKTVEARLYTLHRGVLPIFSTSMYCRNCHTRYYLNYAVSNAKEPNSVRRYYGGIPEILHVHETSFVERDLCIFIENEMAFSHASSESISRVYNLALGVTKSGIPNTSSLSVELSGELVLDSFFLHALIRDTTITHQRLELPHKEIQRNRYNQALSQRNERMVGNGQEMWLHACKKCLKTWVGDDGKTYYASAGVCDGTDVIRTRCWVDDCRLPLASVKDHFCPLHADRIYQCQILNCGNAADGGHITCSIKTHRQWEDKQMENASFMNELRLRSSRAGGSPSKKAGASSEFTSGYSFDEKAKKDEAKRSIKGQSTRRWTHNEQLFVRCCGVIISRATFFTSEGVSAVKNFIKITFPPEYPGMKPTYIYYDNACNLLKHILSENDEYFNDVGLVVDVFHARNKHHEGDTFCASYTNPAAYAELTGKDGRSLFNSSAAEQANAWFGKFKSIVREMPAPKFEFFLDEMISIRNRFLSGQLYKQGACPHFMPSEALYNKT